MASAGIHVSGADTFEGRLVNKASVPYSFISFHVSDAIALYLPCGAEGPPVARALAAELLKAADEQEALLKDDACRCEGPNEATQFKVVCETCASSTAVAKENQ